MFYVGIFIIAGVFVSLRFGRYVSTNGLLMALVFFAVYLLMHLVYLLFYWLCTLPHDRTKPIQKQKRMARMGCVGVASILNAYLGAQVTVRGASKLPRDSQFLFVCNHRSMFDPLITMDRLQMYNISFVSKPENMKIPLVGDIAYSAGFLSIDRENDREALKTILTAADYIKRHVCSIGIYPEGTRNKNDELLPFHAGSFKIAMKAQCPIAICCIRGTEDVKKFLTSRKHRAYLDILEVLKPEQVASMSSQELAEYAQYKIQMAIYTPEDENPTGVDEADEAAAAAADREKWKEQQKAAVEEAKAKRKAATEEAIAEHEAKRKAKKEKKAAEHAAHKAHETPAEAPAETPAEEPEDGGGNP